MGEKCVYVIDWYGEEGNSDREDCSSSSSAVQRSLSTGGDAAKLSTFLLFRV